MRRLISIVRHRLWRPIYLAKRLVRCPLSEKRLLLTSIAVLPLIALSLRFVRFQRVQAALANLSRPSSTTAIPAEGSDFPTEITTICRSVRVAARQYRGRFTCLPQALLLWWLLRRWGITADLRLGGRRIEQMFEAHAWVEYNGQSLETETQAVASFVPFDTVTNPERQIKSR